MNQIGSSAVIAAESGIQQQQVSSLAERYGFELISLDDFDGEWLLVLTDERLELRQTGKKAPGPVYVDFVAGKSAHRRQYGGGRNQPLAKAVGLKRGGMPTIVDVTAGMGKDAFVFAALGAKVTMVERSPVVAALLEDGLRRAKCEASIEEIANRMCLVHDDSIDYLNGLSSDLMPDVVYMDPMYPHRQKSALVKKEMRLFRTLVGDDLDSGQLLERALKVARKRVVVKRPTKSEPLDDKQPDACSASSNTRYDLYFRGRQ